MPRRISLSRWLAAFGRSGKRGTAHDPLPGPSGGRTCYRSIAPIALRTARQMNLIRFLVAGLACAQLSACALPRIPLLARGAPIERSRTQAGEWQLKLSRDRFSGDVVCRLRTRDGKVRYQSGALAFHFSRKWDVHDAVYRIDGGEPRHWRDDLPELVKNGAPIDRGPLTNGSAGAVWIPAHLLESANRIAIQARPDRPPRVFRIGGFISMHELASARGCAPDSRFSG